MTRESELNSKIEAIKKDLKERTLIAVSKYYPFSDIVHVYSSGHVEFGESRVGELKEKSILANEKRMDEIVWHFIGHLQTNKVNALLKIPNLKYVHSVHSLKLLKEIVKKEDLYIGEELGLFLQVNTSFEEEKSGFETVEEVISAINFFRELNLKKLKIVGLMTMGKFRTDDLLGDAKICFKKLKEVKEQVEEKVKDADLLLSMGMSSDYFIAIEEGSDFVRVGSSIFS